MNVAVLPGIMIVVGPLDDIDGSVGHMPSSITTDEP
jgi:hypothetical protein